MALAYETNVPVAYRTEFIKKVTEIASRLKIDPSWLMIVMKFESAGTFSASVKNPYAEAYGLIQFTNNGISGLGTSLATLKAMTAVQQLDWVEKYLAQYTGKMTDLYQLYLAVFSPAYMGKPDAQKVYISPSAAYTGNRALDTDKNGAITIGEIKKVIAQHIPTGFNDGTTIASNIKDNGLPILIIAVVLIILLIFLKRQ